ncbi:uncharacterized protein LOC128386788 [Panonychus citri]|uniref:uncharacterized protein LOC128386788 n=1 Tax=Panonychus citri TaxID=50023 RepID=UPI002306F490|nr:uncharacterized protein LOC128386788 [Panonychus citri]
MTTESVCAWKEKDDKFGKLFCSIEKNILDKNDLHKEYDELLKESYTSLCDYLRMDVCAGEDPLEKIEEEKKMLKENIENKKNEVKKLDEKKEDWKAKLCCKKDELRKIEEMRDDPNLGIDINSKNKFKVLSKFLNVSYKTDQDGQAIAVLFKDGNRQIRFDDQSRSKQQKMNEFWRILEYIENNNRK